MKIITDETAKALMHTLDKAIEETWGNDKLFCHFCKGKPAQLMQYKYIDGSGEGEAFFCKNCWDRYEDRQDMKQTFTYIPSKKADLSQFPGSFPKPLKKKK